MKGDRIIENEKIEVFDLNGKLVLQSTENPIDMSFRAKGIYIVKVTGEAVKVIKN